MGCDIHGVWQKFEDNKWIDIPSNYEQNRHYQLFAILAGVRNNYDVTPISKPKGLPEDFLMDDDAHPIESSDIMDTRRQEYFKDDKEIWMGGHSFSYLTGEEILKWDPIKVVQSGIINKEQFMVWDGKSRPSSYARRVYGPNIKVVYIPDDSNWTHIWVKWESNMKEELDYFLDEVKRLVDLHGNIRFVFGFDN